MPNPEAVLFDWDDTLKVTFENILPVYQGIGRMFDHELSREELASVWGQGIEVELRTAAGPGSASKSHEELMEIHDIEIEKMTQEPHAGAPELVSDITSVEMPTGIVSTYLTDRIRGLMPKVGFDPEEFELVHGKDVTIAKKPDPQVFDKALQHMKGLGINRNQVIYIGDDIRDGRASEAAGIQFLGVTSGMTPAEAFHEGGYDVVENLHQARERLFGTVAVPQLMVPETAHV